MNIRNNFSSPRQNNVKFGAFFVKRSLAEALKKSGNEKFLNAFNNKAQPILENFYRQQECNSLYHLVFVPICAVTFSDSYEKKMVDVGLKIEPTEELRKCVEEMKSQIPENTDDPEISQIKKTIDSTNGFTTWEEYNGETLSLDRTVGVYVNTFEGVSRFEITGEITTSELIKKPVQMLAFNPSQPLREHFKKTSEESSLNDVTKYKASDSTLRNVGLVHTVNAYTSYINWASSVLNEHQKNNVAFNAAQELLSKYPMDIKE